MEIRAYCDVNDSYLRAIDFHFDDIGGYVGCRRKSRTQVRGDTMSPGECLIFNYDMSNVKFSNPGREKGFFFIISKKTMWHWGSIM